MGSISLSLFVASSESLNDFAASIERILEIQFSPEYHSVLNVSPELFPFLFIDFENHTWLAILPIPHGYENDRELNFEDYTHQIMVDRFIETTEYDRDASIDESNHVARAYAKTLFEMLKASNKYSLIVVEDAQRLINRFDIKA